MLRLTTETEGNVVDTDGMVEIKDFSFSPEPKQFRINDDIFQCAPELPLGVMAKVAELKLDAETLRKEGLEPVLQFFDEVMYDASAARFRQRVSDKTQPIGMRHVMAILPWLLEVYGLRPTQPSEDSSASPESDGTSSTDGASAVELIPSSSESLDSSTSSTSSPSTALLGS